MRYTKYPELKKQLKKLAKEIRYYKSNRKYDKRKAIGLSLYSIHCTLDDLRHEFRHKHIAYCLLRGREYEEIENTCREAPDFKWIEEMVAYEQKVICASA